MLGGKVSITYEENVCETVAHHRMWEAAPEKSHLPG